MQCWYSYLFAVFSNAVRPVVAEAALLRLYSRRASFSLAFKHLCVAHIIFLDNRGSRNLYKKLISTFQVLQLSLAAILTLNIARYTVTFAATTNTEPKRVQIYILMLNFF